MTWLLGWLFPIWFLLPKARRMGTVTIAEVQGAGWMCTIRPPYAEPWRRVNSWSGTAATMGGAIRAALAFAAENPTSDAGTTACVPKLGGREFDPYE